MDRSSKAKQVQCESMFILLSNSLFKLTLIFIFVFCIYSNEEKYKQLITDLKIESDVKVVNEFIKDSEVGRYFCAADIVAQPYKNATQSGVTQIGYHFETPMLVTNVGGLPEMIPDGRVGYVVEPNPESISNALEDFFNSDKEILFRENLKVEKQKYLWDKLTAKILQLANG